MRGLFTILIASALALFSCEKSGNIDTVVPEGSYIGTFNRHGMDTAHVTLHLEQGKFRGNSDRLRYPAIGGGTYQADGNTIHFNDTASWTADFDWTLILTGTYNFNYNGNSLRIWKTSGAITDEYNLARLIR